MHILDVPWAEKQQFDWDGKTWQVHQPNIVSVCGACVRVCVHACVRVCMGACVCGCVHACVHACVCGWVDGWVGGWYVADVGMCRLPRWQAAAKEMYATSLQSR